MWYMNLIKLIAAAIVGWTAGIFTVHFIEEREQSALDAEFRARTAAEQQKMQANIQAWAAEVEPQLQELERKQEVGNMLDRATTPQQARAIIAEHRPTEELEEFDRICSFDPLQGPGLQMQVVKAEDGSLDGLEVVDDLEGCVSVIPAPLAMAVNRTILEAARGDEDAIEVCAHWARERPHRMVAEYLQAHRDHLDDIEGAQS